MTQKQSDRSKHPLKQRIFSVAELVCAAALIIGSVFFVWDIASKELVISANVNGVPVGYIRSWSDMENAYSKLCLTTSDASEGSYSSSFNINYDYAYAVSPEYLSQDDCYEVLWSQIENDFCTAYALYVDDRFAAAHEDKDDLNSLIESIESDLVKTIPGEFSDVEISSRIRIEQKLCLKKSLKTSDEINALLNPVLDTERTAQDDDVITARVSAIEASAPKTAAYSDDLTLDYNFLTTVTLTEPIPFETEFVDDYDHYIGTESVATEGEDGVKSVTYELVYDTNGDYIGRNVIAQAVIKEARNRVILVGAAEIPDAVPTGTFMWPCEQPKGVSSYYGWRDLYGKPDFHLGIDIPDTKGSKIWAADGGTVIFAGRTSSYGYNVHVMHTNGYSTLYAHLDSILVEAGDNVYIGQQIGTMGSTGVAYGTHLHFEVRINNKTVDPMKYLPEK